jgi:phage protein D
MRNFNRVCAVRVGKAGDEGLEIRDNKIKFTVVKNDKPESNSLEVTLYNLAPATRTAFETAGNRLELYAGYKDGPLMLVAMGNIHNGKTELPTGKENPNAKTVAQCGDGLMTLRDSRVSLSYASNVSAKQVIGDIAAKMKLDIKQTDADMSGTYIRGYSFTGAARDALNEVTKRFGLDWSVQNEMLQITDRRKPATKEITLINKDTGMVKSPTRQDTMGIDREADKNPPGLTVTTLLLPSIEPRDIVAIEAQGFSKAEYLVRSVTHKGDTYSTTEWRTTLSVTEL